jgi:hypothetical protein
MSLARNLASFELDAYMTVFTDFLLLVHVVKRGTIRISEKSFIPLIDRVVTICYFGIISKED